MYSTPDDNSSILRKIRSIGEISQLLSKLDGETFGRIPLVPSFFDRLSSVFGRLHILFFWYCLPKPVGLEGLPNFLPLELEDFARILVLMCFLW